MFKTYDLEIKKLLATKASDIDWKGVLEHHGVMIVRIQHERLIHLLVTIFVGTILSIAAFIIITTGSPYLLFFCVPLFFLFIAYIFHYRFLENTTQNWYVLEDEIKDN